MKGLQKFIDKSALPEDYGGTLPKADELAEVGVYNYENNFFTITSDF